LRIGGTVLRYAKTAAGPLPTRHALGRRLDLELERGLRVPRQVVRLDVERRRACGQHDDAESPRQYLDGFLHGKSSWGLLLVDKPGHGP
jgi:hypothetical protein